MGMFDNIICKFPLPLPEFQANEFQTKDTPAQYLDLYEIREDGTIWHEEYDTEDQSVLGKWRREHPGQEPPPEVNTITNWAGCAARVNKRWVQLTDFHDDLRFYNSIGHHSSGWVEFSARFTDGKLAKLTLIEHRPMDPAREEESEKRLRALFANR